MSEQLIFYKKPLILFLICFLLFVGKSNAQNLDIDLLRNFNQKRNTKLDNSFKVVTNSVLPVGVGVPLGLFATGILTKDKVTRNNGLEVGASFIMTTCIFTSVKIAVKRPRPYVTYPDLQNLETEKSFSFPSGHTSAAFATATSLSLCYPKWYVIAPSFTWACLSGYSRMHLGVHYPSDVLVGALIGVGSSLLVHQGAKWMQNKSK